MAPDRTTVHATFLNLERYLCQLKNRTGLFRDRETDDLVYGHHALAGRVVRRAHDFLRNSGLSGIPTRKDLAGVIHASANQMTQLFQQKPPMRRNWCAACSTLLTHLLQEAINHNTQDATLRVELNRIRDRIRHYFYRPARTPKQDEVSAFFRFARRFAGHPCSLQELALEIAWFAREPEVGRFGAEVTVILGSDPFPSHDPRKQILNALGLAVHSGVQVTFVLPQVGTQVIGVDTIDQFQEQFPDLSGKFRCLQALPDGLYESNGDERLVAGPLSEAGISFTWGHLLHMRSLPHEENPDPDEGTCVYLNVRRFTSVHPPQDNQPIAFPGTPADEAAFQQWRDAWQVEARPLATADRQDAAAPTVPDDTPGE